MARDPAKGASETTATAAIGEQRALAALRLASGVAGGGLTGPRLFPDADRPGLALTDPVAPVSHLFATRHNDSAGSGRYIRALFAAARAIDPAIRTVAIEFADEEAFRPVAADWADPRSRLLNHRDMGLRLAVYRGEERLMQTPWEPIPSALPWPWLRDLLIPATVTREGHAVPGFIQPFHWAALVPLANWLQPEFAATGLAFTMYADGAELEALAANHQNHGGGLLPLAPRTAIVGTGMSAGLRAELERHGVACVASDVPTWTEHVDELYAVVPDPRARCGRALLCLEPVPAANDDETRATVRAIAAATGATAAALRRLPGFGDLRCLPVATPVRGQRVVDFNPLNLVAFPLPGRLAVMLGKPVSDDRAHDIRTAFAALEPALGYPIELHFIDLSAIDPKTAGGLHCATMELRLSG